MATSDEQRRMLIRLLRESLTERGVRQWLLARNRALGGERPIDLIREGRLDEVHAAAASFVDGDYV